jgi:hypothetical protein
MCWGEGPTDDDVLHWIPKDFSEYYSSTAYHDDCAAACPKTPLKSLKRAGTCEHIRGTINGSETSSAIDSVKIHRFD